MKRSSKKQKQKQIKNRTSNIKRRQNLKEVGAKFVHSFILEKQSGTIQLSSGSSGSFIQFLLNPGEKARE